MNGALLAYDLNSFCADARNALKEKALSPALEDIAVGLRKLLANRDFVRAAFDEADLPGKTQLYHDSETGFYVFAHVQAAGKGGKPHSHGASWAIYGNALGFTDMTEWRRVNDASEEAHVLEASDSYSLATGQTRAYGPGIIHSTAHPQKAWVVRVTGTDLDALPRFHFKRGRDAMAERA